MTQDHDHTGGWYTGMLANFLWPIIIILIAFGLSGIVFSRQAGREVTAGLELNTTPENPNGEN